MKMSVSATGFLRTALIITALLILPSSAAFAQVDFNSNEGQFIQQNPNLRSQTFQAGKVGVGEGENCDTPVDRDSNDNCFSPGDILPGIAFTTDPDNGDITLNGPLVLDNNNPVKVLVPDGSVQDSVILFPGNVVTAVGINIGCLFDFQQQSCDNETYFVDVYGANDELLGSTTVPVTSLFDTFVGITSSVPIEKIQFGDANPQVLSFNGVSRVIFPLPEGITIPTLSEWGMIAAVLGFGLIGFIAIRRRASTSTNKA